MPIKKSQKKVSKLITCFDPKIFFPDKISENFFWKQETRSSTLKPKNSIKRIILKIMHLKPVNQTINISGKKW